MPARRDEPYADFAGPAVFALVRGDSPGGDGEFLPDRRDQFHSGAPVAGGGAEAEFVQPLDGGGGAICRKRAAGGTGPDNGVAEGGGEVRVTGCGVARDECD